MSIEHSPARKGDGSPRNGDRGAGEDDDDVPALRPIPEFCRRYRVSRDFVYDALRLGILEGVKVGPRTHITGPSEARWLASLPKFRSRSSAQPP
jgi:hypothetical protein